MSAMIEVYLKDNQIKFKNEVVEAARNLAGTCSFEESSGSDGKALCLTLEFDQWDSAEKASSLFRNREFYVEGPYNY